MSVDSEGEVWLMWGPREHVLWFLPPLYMQISFYRAWSEGHRSKILLGIYSVISQVQGRTHKHGKALQTVRKKIFTIKNATANVLYLSWRLSYCKRFQSQA